jgi:hypothetical protein
MHGLRVYINPVDADKQGASEVFYTRRDDGPLYRWQYTDGSGRWHCSRLRAMDFAPSALSPASWKAVPVELQASLVQHYLE